MGKGQTSPGTNAKLCGTGHQAFVWGIARWVGKADLHPKRSTQQCQRVVDVVPVPDECDGEALQPTEMLLHREDVGESLARVFTQGQPVDDRDVGLRGQLDRHFVRSCPNHDAVDEPVKVMRNVTDTLARAKHDVVGQVDRMPTKLGHARLKGDPRAQAGLLEEHRQGPSSQRRDGMTTRRTEFGLESCGRLEQMNDLRRRQVRHAQQVAAVERSGGRHQRRPPRPFRPRRRRARERASKCD